MDLLEHARKLFYWQRYDYIGKPVTTNVYFSDPDFNLTGNTNGQGYIVARINPAYFFHISPAIFSHLKGKIPLKICEENLFNKKIWNPDGSLEWQCDNNIKKDGLASIKLTTQTPSNAEVYSPLIKVEPNRTYRLSYWVKTENLTPQDAQVYGKIVVAQYNQNTKEDEDISQNRIDAGFSLGENIGGTNNWTKKSYSFNTNSQTVYIRLRAPLGLAGKAKGTTWFDQIDIKELVSLEFILANIFGNDLQIDTNKDNKVNLIDFFINALMY